MDRIEFEHQAPSLRESIVRMVVRMNPGGDGARLADDVAQDTLLRLWSMRDRLDSYSSVNSLALVIARNITIDMIRQASGRSNVALENCDSADSSPTPEEATVNNETAGSIDRIVASLPSAQQALIRMRHIEEMEIDEIAAVTGSSPGAIRVALSRVRTRVRDLFLNQQDR